MAAIEACPGVQSRCRDSQSLSPTAVIPYEVTSTMTEVEGVVPTTKTGRSSVNPGTESEDTERIGWKSVHEATAASPRSLDGYLEEPRRVTRKRPSVPAEAVQLLIRCR